ncbi:hypothetical protein F4813DRAFT_208691 [Daldinia decipiens]|uniref:uncharacterized protein n=1 Tax=Daldinia decipiens TaxID=326647 RepID=UPI0020C2FA0A|nr:uncharacterized protein F4813DRAFT_208691 [Daldinia decipiens]KAI1654441.1 hypothetical protein F4813DRAFT_208691 [Daldinia decipiens]
MSPRPPLRQLTRLYTLSHQLPKLHHGRLPPPVRSISTTPAPRVKARAPLHRNTFIQIRFAEADIPDLSFWTKHTIPPFVPDGEVSPTQCLEACKRYVHLAIENKPNWQQRNLSPTATSPTTHDGSIPLFTLHYAAITLLLFAQTPGHRFLALHILTTAATAGYAPSTLTLARLGHKTNNLQNPQFAHAKESLATLLANPSRSPEYRPDTLTLAALVQLAAPAPTRATADRATQLLEDASKAYSAAGGTTAAAAAAAVVVYWHWRARAVLALSRLLIERKQTARARAILRAAAAELDDPEICFRYAELLPRPDAERRVLIQRAAVSGVEEAAREMARETRASLEEEEQTKGLSAWERRARGVIADEWAGIAGDKAVL